MPELSTKSSHHDVWQLRLGCCSKVNQINSKVHQPAAAANTQPITSPTKKHVESEIMQDTNTLIMKTIMSTLKMRISIIALSFLVIGCHQSQNPPKPSVSSLNSPNGTLIESAMNSGSVSSGPPTVLRYSNTWDFEKPRSPNSTSEKGTRFIVQGIVAIKFRGDQSEVTRGILLTIVDPDFEGGEGYLDLDEVETLNSVMDRFCSGHEKSLEIRGDALVGMSFRTKGMVFFRTGQLGTVLGVQKSKSKDDISISDLSTSDLAEIKMKITLARQWAERQVP